ncbi:hypothetical protein Hanom_Chr00s003400g01712281 [Helianthus anomalus]
MHKSLVSLLVCILFMHGGLGRSCIEKERPALLDVKANLNNFHGHLDDWGGEEEKMVVANGRVSLVATTLVM